MTQKKYHILKEYANGVMDEKGCFYPYKLISLSSDLAAKPGIRYYIKTVYATTAKAGASAADVTQFIFTQDKQIVTFVVVRNPETFVASNNSVASQVSVGILTDLATGLDSTLNGLGILFVVLAEVEELEGEYLG